MYCKHYGFTEKPFDVTPKPKFLFLTRGHREALVTLLYGIRERRGFIAMVGEAGTGKTTLLRSAMEKLGKKTRKALLFHSEMPFEDVIHVILDEFKMLRKGETLTKLQAVKRLTRFAIHLFAKGGNLVIMIDEAQNFSRETLEGLRMISNLETNNYKLIQIVIAGQVELDRKLDNYGLRPFVQRINLKRYIKQLNEKETYAYLAHRLKVANYKGSPIFDKRSQQMIWAYSGGVPRKINNICDNALLHGYAMEAQTISGRVIAEVVNDLGYTLIKEPSETPLRKIVPLRRVAMF